MSMGTMSKSDNRSSTMISKKKNLKFCTWLSVLVTIVTGLIASRYMVVCQDPTVVQTLHFYAYTIGQVFLLAFIVNFFISFGATFVLPKKAALFVVFVVNLLFLILFTSDTFVFQLYRFHLNWAMIDLFINGGSEVIHFSGQMWGQIALIVCGLSLLVIVLIIVSSRLVEKIVVWPLTVIFIACFVVGHLSHAWASARHDTEITWMAEYVPWARPLTMNRFLSKYGFAPEIDDVDLTKMDNNKALAYPLKELAFKNKSYKRNIIFVIVDSLRSDMVTKEIMPNLWGIGKENLQFNNHYSSGNATRAGIFGLFYGLPPSYWHSALRGKVPSAFITSLQKQGYKIEAFASARLTSPEFNKTVFASVPNIRIQSKGENAWDRDLNSIKDFSKWVQTVEEPFFAFIFLDNVHAYQLDPHGDRRFFPYWKTVNNLKLSADTDPEAYFNLYKNAVHDADKNIEKIWSILREKDLLDSSIVLISSDHGEEFNDNKLNYWGHNSNFTDAQIKIPLVLHWPGKTPKMYRHLTTAYDVSATLLREELSCMNDMTDYSVGQSLFDVASPRKWFLSGDYNNLAIIEDERIVVIDRFGMLKFKDKRYNKTENNEKNKNMLEALELIARYRK